MSEDRGKQKMTAALLAFFAGFLGVHHFYLGSNTAGIVCIVANVFCLGGLIGLIEFVMLLTMSDEDFDAKYNQREPEAMEFVFQKK